MAHIPRNRKRESDRSGFDYKEIQLVRDKGSLVGPDEYDAPPPSNESLGGEGEISGDPRPNSDSYATPAENDKQVQYITAAGGISYSNIEPWLYIVGSNQNVNVSADPQISRASHGTKLTLECIGSAVLLENGSGLDLRRHFNMDSGAIINLIYNGTDNLWHETSRSHRVNLGVF